MKLQFVFTTQQGAHECMLIEVYSYTERDSDTVFFSLNGVKGPLIAGQRLTPASSGIRDDFSVSSPRALGRRFEEAKGVL